jgi:conjugative relaxase-like TrwC/TraI family protein
MLRINAIPNAAAAKAYYSLADYLIEGREHEARWHGKGAELLGLQGKVDQNVFEVLCDNINPNDGKQLTAKHVENRRVGYDFTFSVPKSVSVAYALGLDDRLPGEFRAAVADTMAEVEREMATRVRRKGADHDRHTGNMLWCDFFHLTSRPINGTPDPQLHVHAVAFNATYDREEGQWKAGQFGELKANAPYFQAVFRARLANRLQALGYDLKVKRDDFEIAGVPERALKEFSRRTSLIEKLADQLGVTKPETKAKLGATSREAKKEGQTWGALVAGWEKRLQPGELQQVRDAVDRSRAEPVKLEFDNREALDWSLRHCLERKSVVGQRELLTTALRHGLGHVTLDGLHDELGKRKDLIRRDLGGQAMVSTQGVLSEEKRIVAFAVKGRGKCKPMGQKLRAGRDPGSTDLLNMGYAHDTACRHPSLDCVPAFHAAAAKPDPATLTPSQSSAVKHALTTRDRLILIRGAAGTGKTTMTRTLLEQVNVPWVILAPSAEASRGVLRRDGFHDADTLASFLTDHDAQEKARNGLIVLDEASLAGAHDMARLIQVADSLDARVLLLGDKRQHRSVSRGDVLTMLEDRAGLPVAEVTEVKRQTHKGYREAAELMGRGDVAGGFAKLDALGWIKTPDQFRGVTEMVVDDYIAAVKQGTGAIIVAPTHAEGDFITMQVRARLRKEGRLGGEEHELPVLKNLNYTKPELEEAKKNPPEGVVLTRYGAYQPGTRTLAVGDCIRFTANGKTLDKKHRLNNGAVYTVGGFTKDGDMKLLENGWTVGKDYKHWTHGYTHTTFAAQGKGEPLVFVSMPTSTLPAVNAAAGYVAATRGKQKVTIYTDDRESLFEAVKKQDKRLLATDLVRLPKRGVRERLKRHVSWLRSMANRVMDRGKELTMNNREHSRE